jgi:hypothetical protein
MGAPHGTPQVDLHEVLVPVQVLRADFLEQGLRGDARVVDQRVQPAEAAHGLVHEVAALRLHRDVHRDGEHLAAVGAALCGHGVQLGGAAAGHHQGEALAVPGGELARHLGPDAVRAAGDEGHVHGREL